MYLCMFTQHSKTENKHHGHELTTVTFIFNLIALKNTRANYAVGS